MRAERAKTDARRCGGWRGSGSGHRPDLARRFRFAALGRRPRHRAPPRDPGRTRAPAHAGSLGWGPNPGGGGDPDEGELETSRLVLGSLLWPPPRGSGTPAPAGDVRPSRDLCRLAQGSASRAPVPLPRQRPKRLPRPHYAAPDLAAARGGLEVTLKCARGGGVRSGTAAEKGVWGHRGAQPRGAIQFPEERRAPQLVGQDACLAPSLGLHAPGLPGEGACAGRRWGAGSRAPGRPLPIW